MKRTTNLTEAQKRALEPAKNVTGRSDAPLDRDRVHPVSAPIRAVEPTPPLFDSGEPDLADSVEEALDGFGER